MPTDTNPEPQPFHCDQGDGAPDVRYQGPDLHDVTLLDLDDAHYLALVASPPSRVGEEPRQREIRLWRFDEASRHVQPLETRQVDLPFPKETTLASSGGQVIAAGASNFQWPGFVGRWPAGPEWSGVRGTLDAQPVALTGEQVRTVAVPLQWSTVGLPCAAWLYGPRLHPQGAVGEVLVTMETTDGKAVLWQYDARRGAPAPMATIPDAVDPVIFLTTDGMQTVARIPDAQWSGFHDSPCYSFARGPVALPVSVIVGVGDTMTRHELYVPIGESFAFDAIVDPAGGFFVASAGGAREAPQLTVYQAPRLDRYGTLRDSFALPHAPIEVRMLAGKAGLLVAVLYQVGGERAVECYYRPLQA